MTAPMKDFRPELREHTHRDLARIAKARRMTITALGRQIIEEYVAQIKHEAKVILGQDDDDPDAPESSGISAESSGTRRSPHR